MGPLYPSDRPILNGEGGYQARVITGPGRDYAVYVMMLSTSDRNAVMTYIDARRVDGRWALGIDEVRFRPLSRAEQVVERSCRSTFDQTPTQRRE